jgi:hypothetical protein
MLSRSSSSAPPTADRDRPGSAPTEAPATDRVAGPGWAPPIDGHGLFKSLMLRLPRGVRRSLDHEQLLAIRQAAEEMAWGEHPIDIRLSLPWPGGRRYVVLLGGRDQRGPAKRLQKHTRASAIRVGNIASFVVLLGLLLTSLITMSILIAILLPG